MSYSYIIGSLDMSDREDTRVESHSNPIVLSDGENDGEFDSDIYTSLDA